MPSRLPSIYIEAGEGNLHRFTMIPYDSVKLRFRQTPTQDMISVPRYLKLPIKFW